MPSPVITDTLQSALQSTDLFDFPAPPSQHLGHSRHPSVANGDNAEVTGETCTDAAASRAPSPLPSLELEVHFAPRFARASKSTTSLPAFSSRDIGQFHAGESAPDANSMPGNAPPFLQARAAKSHHHLPYVGDHAPLSQSLLSLTSRCEQVTDIAELLTPIASGSFEFDAGQSLGTITIVSHAHAHVPPQPMSAQSEEEDQMYEYQPPSPQHSSPSPSHQQSLPSQQQQQHPPPPLSLPQSDHGLEPASRGGEHPAVLLRARMSMVQMGIRNNSRNSMVVGDMLFPGIGSNDRGLALPAEKKALPKSTRYTMDAELAADIGTRRESRYLYDVPGSSLGGSVHGTISRALQWSQRISHGPPRQLHRTRSSIVDQHKIYDIYEESIWHTARTPIALPSAATDAKTGVSRFHFGLGGSSALESLRSGFGNKSAPTGGATGNPHTNVLRSVKSASAPWNMIRSWKNRDSSSRKRTEWDLSSVSTESSYSEVDGCSTLSDSECQDDRSHQHKHSAIHLLVKRAGHGLMRRSASFYRSISGTTLASSASGGESKAEHTRPSSSSDSRGPVLSPANASGARRAIGRRLASAMRLAGGKLRGTWRPSSASLAPSEDDSDIVSAYPADPSAEEALDSYLSMSAIHSPVLPSVASANTGKATAVATATTAYVPPKRPPYLGLHRKSVVERDLDAASQADPVQQHMGVARARSTQFKSPFTTLPYGAYHQAK